MKRTGHFMTRELPCSTSRKVPIEDLLEENYYMKLGMFLFISSRLTKSHFLTFESHQVITQGVSPGYHPLESQAKNQKRSSSVTTTLLTFFVVSLEYRPLPL